MVGGAAHMTSPWALIATCCPQLVERDDRQDTLTRSC
jgi:hypothetical protein